MLRIAQNAQPITKTPFIKNGVFLYLEATFSQLLHLRDVTKYQSL